MKSNDISGKFYDIYEQEDKLIFRIYGRKKKEFATFEVISKFRNVGVKVMWLIAGVLSPLYLLVLFLEAMIVALFLFLMAVAIVSGTDLYLVIGMGFVFSFVFTVGIGRMVRVMDPKISMQKAEKRKVVITEIES